MNWRDVAKKTLSCISLSTPTSIVICLTFVHIVLLLVSYETLENAQLSLYERAGIPSPSIGMTRAYWRVLHGEFALAYERNKLIVVIAPLLWAIYGSAMYRLYSSRKNQKSTKDTT